MRQHESGDPLVLAGQVVSTDGTPAGRTRINTCTILRAYPNGAVEARWETTTYEPIGATHA